MHNVLCPRCHRAPARITHLCQAEGWTPPEPEDPPILEGRLTAATAAACEILGHFTHLGRLVGCQGQEIANAALLAADRHERIRLQPKGRQP